MIERVYIDNYKSFVNFELRPEAIQLVLGGNGSGKTTFFDVLESIRDFVSEGHTTIHSFPASTLTAWDKRRAQTFELRIKGNTEFVQRYRNWKQGNPVGATPPSMTIAFEEINRLGL